MVSGEEEEKAGEEIELGDLCVLLHGGGRDKWNNEAGGEDGTASLYGHESLLVQISNPDDG